MRKSKIFLILTLSFIGGVGAVSFYHPSVVDDFFLLLLVVFSLILMAVFFERRKLLIFGWAVLLFVLGIFWTSESLSNIKEVERVGENFSGEVRVVDEPQIKGRYQKLVVAADDAMQGKILINAMSYPEYAYGDRLRVTCDLRTPENFSDDFDYRMYLAKENIFYECKKFTIERLSVGQGNKFYATLLAIRNKFNQKIATFLPAPQSGLLSGLILGGDAFLSKEYQDNFSKTGTTHIIAVSGYNVTIIAEYLMILGIFLGLWRKQAFWFAAVGIILFVIITGLAASAVRAGVMGILLIWAMKNGRLANSKNALLFAAAAMLLANPLLLRWDVGFQLSFLATLGIIYFYPLFEKSVVKKQKVFGLSEILFLTLSAQIFVLPIILYNFGRLSLISPLANLLILPIIPLTMLLGFMATIFGFISYPLGQIFSWLVYIPLRYETEMIGYLASLKYSSLDLNFPWWGIIGWYIILASILCLKEKQFIGR